MLTLEEDKNNRITWLITRLIVFNITPLTLLFCNCCCFIIDFFLDNDSFYNCIPHVSSERLS